MKAEGERRAQSTESRGSDDVRTFIPYTAARNWGPQKAPVTRHSMYEVLLIRSWSCAAKSDCRAFTDSTTARTVTTTVASDS
jgi:hypothetical protein